MRRAAPVNSLMLPAARIVATANAMRPKSCPQEAFLPATPTARQDFELGRDMATSRIGELESIVLQRDARLESLEAEVACLTEQKQEAERCAQRAEARAQEALDRAEDEHRRCIDSEARAVLAESCMLELEGRVIKENRNAEKATTAWLREAQLKDEAIRRAEIAEQHLQNMEARMRAMEREMADIKNRAAERVRGAENQAQHRIRSADRRTEAVEQRLFASQKTASSLITHRSRRSETPQSRSPSTTGTPRASTPRTSSARFVGQSAALTTPTKGSTYWSFHSRSQSLGLRSARESVGSTSRISTKASTPPSRTTIEQQDLGTRLAPMADSRPRESRGEQWTPKGVQEQVQFLEEQMRTRASGARSTATDASPKDSPQGPVFGSPDSSQGSPTSGGRSMVELREATLS